MADFLRDTILMPQGSLQLVAIYIVSEVLLVDTVLMSNVEGRQNKVACSSVIYIVENISSTCTEKVLYQLHIAYHKHFQYIAICIDKPMENYQELCQI